MTNRPVAKLLPRKLKWCSFLTSGCTAMARAVSTPVPTGEGLNSEKSDIRLSTDGVPATDGENGDRSEGIDVEEDKVVVERNGRFLLVSKDELEADITMPPENSASEPYALSASQCTVNDATKEQQSVNKANGRLEEDVQVSPHPAVPCSQACSTKDEPTCTSTEAVVECGGSPSKHVFEGSSNGELTRGAEKSTPPPQSFTRPVNSQLTRAKGRLYSAPASRSHSTPWLSVNPTTVKGSLLVGEDEDRRRRLNDEAFRSWLARKNRERIQKQKEKDGSIQDVSEEERRDRNVRAFQCWLANKQKQVQTEVTLRPVSAHPQSQGVPSSRGRESTEAVYEEWVRRKQAELQSKKKLELERKKEVKEMAISKDSQAGDKAFQM